jgi:predicted metalloprotease with PDZ domain
MVSIIQANLTEPGRKYTSARMASFLAPFWDGAPQPQPTNLAETYFDYYTKGAGLALYLDLYIRNRTDNRKSLNDAFNNLKARAWNAPNSSYYLQGRGYTEDDVERSVSDAAGTTMQAWFDRYVGGTEDLDVDEALGWAGLRLVRDEPTWRIEELPDPSPAQLRVRLGWVTGRLDR